MNNTKEKEEIPYRIGNAVLKLEISKGHFKWKISEVSKEAGVTRSLIYYYYGKDKETILEESYRHLLTVLYSEPGNEKATITERMRFVLDYIKKIPFVFVLYYLQRNSQSRIGDLIRQKEEALFIRLKKEFPQKTEVEIKRIYFVELGAIAFGVQSDEISQYFS